MDFPSGSVVGNIYKESTCQHKTSGFAPWVGKITRRRKLQPTPVFLPGEANGQRSLAGCSPWGYKELKSY